MRTTSMEVTWRRIKTDYKTHGFYLGYQKRPWHGISPLCSPIQFHWDANHTFWVLTLERNGLDQTESNWLHWVKIGLFPWTRNKKCSSPTGGIENFEPKVISNWSVNCIFARSFYSKVTCHYRTDDWSRLLLFLDLRSWDKWNPNTDIFKNSS